MPRILLVSNRLSITIEKRNNNLNYKQSVGGLATGLGSFYQENNSIWVGWCGLASNGLGSNIRKKIVKRCLDQYSCYPTFLSKKDIRLFYAGFCNKMIWPLFHYFTDYAVYDTESWKSYKQVNKLFSQDVLKIARPDDIIWIHDYHLMLLPQLLREELPNTHIGFFLHVPFPSYEIFRQIPWRNEILEGLLGADLIGFHTYNYVRHFFSSVRRLLGYEHTFGQLTVENRIVKQMLFQWELTLINGPMLKWTQNGSEISNVTVIWEKQYARSFYLLTDWTIQKVFPSVWKHSNFFLKIS